jgi:UDP-N-acetylmuramyl pentapeptide phosphotransferase/UDP-N-acetylglucosamine-1-phosphate transferase
MLIGQLLALFLLAAVLSALLTSLWVSYARSRQIEDLPGQRRLHSSSTPRGGGIAIAAVLLLALIWIGSDSPSGGYWIGLAAGIALFAALGLLDDLVPTPALVKFVLQLVAASVMVLAMSQGWALGWLALIGLIVAGAYVVNIWNFMDGSNGLIGVQALLISLAMAFWPEQPVSIRLFAIALAGACAGFLPFNLPRAQVFLGDVGSHALGAAVFGLLLLAWHAGTVGLAQVLLIGTAVLLDSGFTLIRRAVAGRRVWRAHREHLYQYAVRSGNSHAMVCLSYGAFTAFAILLAGLGQFFRVDLARGAMLFVGWALGSWAYFGLRMRWLQKRQMGN